MTVAERLGVAKMYDYVEGFGFMEKTNLDLPGEAKGIVYNEKNMTEQNWLDCVLDLKWKLLECYNIKKMSKYPANAERRSYEKSTFERYPCRCGKFCRP